MTLGQSGLSGWNPAVQTGNAPQRTDEMRVGDRVRTGHNTGTIVAVDGDKYLVDLDGQPA